jgi:hypothetical protein
MNEENLKWWAVFTVPALLIWTELIRPYWPVWAAVAAINLIQ